MKKKYFLLFFGLFLFIMNASSAYAAPITAEIDRHTISVGETFNLTLNIADQDSDSQPDFTMLEKDFSIIGTSRSTQMTIINGKSSNSNQWIITLIAKHTGTITIPSITIGNASSAPLTMTVSPATAPSKGGKAPEIFIETTITPNDIYVQSQAIFTIRLYYRNHLTNGTLTEPDLKEAVIDRLGKDVNFRAEKYKEQYQVIERRYAVFPQSDGKLQISPIIFNGEVSQGSDRSNSFYSYLNSLNKPIRIMSPATIINVKPTPLQAKNYNWLPSTMVSLTESWSESPTRFQVGEPITRTIGMTAEGLAAELLPPLTDQEIPEMKIYPDKPILNTSNTREGVTGQRIEKIAYIPTRTGTITLPAIKVNWWNIKTNHLETASIPSRTIQVLAATKPTSTNLMPQTAPTIGTEIKTPSASTHLSPNLIANQVNYWVWIASGFIVLWLATVTLWFISVNKRTKNDKNSEAENLNLRQACHAIKSACDRNDPLKAKEATLAWGNLVLADNEILSLGALSKYLTTIDAKQQILILDETLYAKKAEAWLGEKLWQAIQPEFKAKKLKLKPKKDEILPPLYPTFDN